MAPVKSKPVYRKPTAASSTRMLVSNAALTKRILSVVKKNEELKRFSFTTTTASNAANTLLIQGYVNWSGGISQGVQLSQRIGDCIYIDHIDAQLTYNTNFGADAEQQKVDADIRLSLVGVTDSATVYGTSPNLLQFATVQPFVTSGYNSIGHIEAVRYRPIADKKKHIRGKSNGPGTGTAGDGALRGTLTMSKKFTGRGYKISYNPGTNEASGEFPIFFVNIEVPLKTSTGIATYSALLNYDIYYRDA